MTSFETVFSRMRVYYLRRLASTQTEYTPKWAPNFEGPISNNGSELSDASNFKNLILHLVDLHQIGPISCLVNPQKKSNGNIKCCEDIENFVEIRIV
jgi:hypothetical protein